MTPTKKWPQLKNDLNQKMTQDDGGVCNTWRPFYLARRRRLRGGRGGRSSSCWLRWRRGAWSHSPSPLTSRGHFFFQQLLLRSPSTSSLPPPCSNWRLAKLPFLPRRRQVRPRVQWRAGASSRVGPAWRCPGTTGRWGTSPCNNTSRPESITTDVNTRACGRTRPK